MSQSWAITTCIEHTVVTLGRGAATLSAVARIAVLVLAALTAGVLAVTGAPHRIAGDSAAKPRPVKAKPGKGLRVLASNPRYFTDGSGRAVYLTGSHVWWNFLGPNTWKVDCDDRGGAERFDFAAYLDFL